MFVLLFFFNRCFFHSLNISFKSIFIHLLFSLFFFDLSGFSLFKLARRLLLFLELIPLLSISFIEGREILFVLNVSHEWRFFHGLYLLFQSTVLLLLLCMPVFKVSSILCFSLIHQLYLSTVVLLFRLLILNVCKLFGIKFLWRLLLFLEFVPL